VKIPNRVLRSSKTAVKKCLLCGEEFLLEAYRLEKAKFCSWTCKQRAAAKQAGIAIGDKYRGKGTRGYVKRNGVHEHRTVAESMLGRPLQSGEIVHHKNENKHDNRPENLEVITQSEHIKIHLPRMRDVRKERHGY
jgi:hypothetical protein